MKNNKNNVWISNLDLIIIVIFSVITSLLIIHTTSIFKIALGLMFIIFIPGYTLISALFPRKNSVSYIERLALSIGSSIAVVSLIGLILSYAYWGIKLIPLIIVNCSFTIIMSIIAFILRHNLKEDARFSFSYLSVILNIFKNSLTVKSKQRQFIIFFILILVSLFIISYLIFQTPNPQKSNEFYILGFYSSSTNYPSQITLGEPVEIKVIIENNKYKPVEYSLIVNLNEKEISRYKQIKLLKNATWEQVISLTPEMTGDNQKIELILLNQNNKIEKELYLYIDVVK